MIVSQMMRVVSIVRFMMCRRVRNCGLLVMMLLVMVMMLVVSILLMVMMMMLVVIVVFVVLVVFMLVLLLVAMMMVVLMVAILMVFVVSAVLMLMVTVLMMFVVPILMVIMVHMMLVMMMLMILVMFMVLVVMVVVVLMVVVLFVEPLYPIAQTGWNWRLPLIRISFLRRLLGLVLVVVCLEPPVVMRPFLFIRFVGLSIKTDMVPLADGWQVVTMYHIVDIRGLAADKIIKDIPPLLDQID